MVAIPVVVLAALGLLVGTAVEGVVASYRQHRGFGPWPRCRGCGHLLAGVARVPLVGGAASRRCVSCGGRRPGRALAIHLATASAFVAVGVPRASSWPALGIALCEAAVLVALLVIDLDTRLIPTALVAVLVALGLGGAALGAGPGVGAALLGGLAGFVAFGALVTLARWRYGAGALGMGDANLALAIGCIVGYPLVVVTLAVGVALGGLVAAAVLLRAIAARRGADGLRAVIPYGPCLIGALLLVMARIIAA